jgi:hypothetical protein
MGRKISWVAALLLTAALSTCAGSIVYVCGDGPDDENCAFTNPNSAAPAPSGVVQNLMDNNTTFTQASGWHFTSGADLTSSMAVDSYFAWVVNSPTVFSPMGASYDLKKRNLDVGGAIFAVTYTPPANPPALPIHFLQVYSESLDGGPVTYHVDNVGLGGAADSPFYDQVPQASVEKQNDGSTWFLDMPFECENHAVCAQEGIEDHYAEFSFGLYLATDDNNGVGGVHNVKVLGGLQWGYSYGTLDTPEPSTACLMLAALLMLLWVMPTLRAGRSSGRAAKHCARAEIQRALLPN